MTMLTTADFDAYFSATNGGRAPFVWQKRLLEHLVEHRTWPDCIDAPTGAGKSSVIDIHAFALAVTAGLDEGGGRRLPRRLALAVDRRALVDSHFDRALGLQAMLSEVRAHPGSASPVVLAVADALAALRPADDPHRDLPIGVAVLRGGLKPDREWLDSPSACQVIAATPDMWGSRLLFNGYGASRYARPREAGLLALDCALVLDEAHLSRQLLCTARRVRELTRADAQRLDVPGLQVTAMTATPDGGDCTTVGVLLADLDADTVLNARLRRPKPVRLHQTDQWSTAQGSVVRLADVVVDRVLDVLSTTEGTVGCVVNTVRLATEVSARLRRGAVPAGVRGQRVGEAIAVEQLVGRMRPWDVQQLRDGHPGLFSLEGDPSVDVIVATQTIEVGVDMDFAALVTELAPGSALAQRAGRLNRSGVRDSAAVTVIAPVDPAVLAKSPGPYGEEELRDGLDWIARRAEDPVGLAPWSIHPSAGGDAPPAASDRRLVFERVESWNVDIWACTSEELFAEHDLDLWLSDDLDRDLTASVVIRQGLPDDPLQALGLLRAAPPQRQEYFPVRLGELRDLIARDVPELERIFVVCGEDVLAVEHADLAGVRLRPEDVVVLDDTSAVFRSKVVSADGDEVMPDVSERSSPAVVGARTVRFHSGAPVLEGVVDSGGVLSELRRLALGEEGQIAEMLDREAGLRDFLAAWARTSLQDTEIDGVGDPGRDSRRLLTALLALEGQDRADILMERDPGAGFWLVVAGTVDRQADDEVRQTWSPRPRGVVDLDVHEAAVEVAVRDVAAMLGLPLSVGEALGLAARHHDAGKSDPRFQRALRNLEGDHAGRILAKSGMRSLQLMRRARERSGLPTGWRHEQLSAVAAWPALADVEAPVRDLAVRLVGTSHGRGRVGFPHTADTLIGPENADFPVAAELFAEAKWDTLVERTHTVWGHWGCAYLEALLRAADGNVSRRGS